MNTSHQELDLERLVLIAGGHTAFQLLWAGIELGLFTYLSAHPASPMEQIASELSLEHQPTRILLTGLVALGLIRKEGDGYVNADLTDTRLVRGKPGYAAPILGWQAHIVYPGMQDFVTSLRENRNAGLQQFPGSGNTLYERLASHSKLEKIFHEAMAALSAQANNFLLQAYDFSKFSHLVDAGGGNGENAMALARQFPELRLTVFDSPTVCAIAQENIKQNGLSNQVSTHAGNFFTDAYPSEVDAILFAHILTIWSMERNTALLRKAYEALPKDGAVLIFNMMGHDDETGPLSTALGSPYFLAIATGEGMLHPWKDYEAALRDAGFSQVKRVEGLPLDHGLLIGIK